MFGKPKLAAMRVYEKNRALGKSSIRDAIEAIERGEDMPLPLVTEELLLWIKALELRIESLEEAK
jgi:hypothetical protein